MNMRNTLLLTCLFIFSNFSFAQNVKPGVTTGHKKRVESLDFSPDGKYVVSAGGPDDGYVILWELRTGRVVRKWDSADGSAANFKAAFDALFTQNGNNILIGSQGHPLQTWAYQENTFQAFDHKEDNDRAVSYTHLTLPTIYSV